MVSETRSHPRPRRCRSVRIAVTTGVLLLFGLGVAGPAWAAGETSPHRIIFDPGATPSWTKRYFSPSSANDSARDVAVTKGGVIYVAGMLYSAAGASDASLAKFVDGAPAWPAPKLYDSPHHGMEMAHDVAVGPDNTVYTACISTGLSGLFDILVVKWSSAGVVKWAKRYDGPSHGMDAPSCMAVDSAGNVTVGGTSANGSGGDDWVVVCWSSSGARRWTSRYAAGEVGQTVPVSLVVGGDRSVYACGLVSNPGGASSMVVRYSPSGKVLWKKTYEGPAGLGALTFAAAPRPGGGVYTCGTAVSATTASDGLVMSYTAKGVRDVFALDTGAGGATEQEFKDLVVTSTGQVVAVGSTLAGANRDCRAVSYTLDGTIAGQFSIPGAWHDEFEAVAADAFGGFYATGRYHTAVNKTAVLTLRGSVITNGGGFTSLWAPAFVSEQNGPNAIAVHGTTACVVGECSEGPGHGIDQLVLGYVY
jgi:hypothetical protein